MEVATAVFFLQWASVEDSDPRSTRDQKIDRKQKEHEMDDCKNCFMEGPPSAPSIEPKREERKSNMPTRSQCIHEHPPSLSMSLPVMIHETCHLA
ncbi:hypothetical protein E4U32_007788 [Claviceps aff. humidiphila group G2b]|nr:hypothetical protein E4U32_007788 [Claviceps aff. humidiphila group G2b]